MTTVYEIPTKPQATRQAITLNGTVYELTLTWCAPGACWIADIADQFGNAILSGVPLVTGADLLAQFAYLGIGDGGALVVQSDNDPALVPSYSTLGSTGHLFFVSPNP